MPRRDPEARKEYNTKYRQLHKDEKNSRERRYYRENTIGARDRHLRKQYGITAQIYDGMLEKQQGRCAACREFHYLVVDHDHSSGAIRGLLCTACNTIAGALEHPHRESVEKYLGAPGQPGRPAS